MNIRIILVLVLAVLLVSSVNILDVDFKRLWQPSKYPVTIAVSKTPLSTPFYVAEAINAFNQTCVAVKYQQVIGGHAAFQQVMNGQVDFGTSSDSVMAFQSLSHQAFVTHAMFVQSDNDVKLVTHADENISSASDLQGKKVAVTKGAAGEYLLSTLLAIEGLSMADIELMYFSPEQLLTAFTFGEVDAIVTWEPFVFQLAQSLKDEIRIHDTKSLSTLSFHLISQQVDNTENIEKAKCIIQGLQSAISYIALNPEKSKQIIIDKLKLQPAFIDWVWQDYIFKLGLNQALLLSIESQALWAVDTDMRESNRVPNPEQFVDSRALLQVEPGAVTIP